MTEFRNAPIRRAAEFKIDCSLESIATDRPAKMALPKSILIQIRA